MAELGNIAIGKTLVSGQDNGSAFIQAQKLILYESLLSYSQIAPITLLKMPPIIKRTNSTGFYDCDIEF
jgi:hypothetical protein